VAAAAALARPVAASPVAASAARMRVLAWPSAGEGAGAALGKAASGTAASAASMPLACASAAASPAFQPRSGRAGARRLFLRQALLDMPRLGAGGGDVGRVAIRN
jgi:hypothetical protein